MAAWFRHLLHSALGHPAGNLSGPSHGQMSCGGCQDSFPLKVLRRRSW